ncbi:MAG: hypothetical protein ACK5Q5_01425, partial [Planctomycetaceae bacterium]
MHSMVRSIVAVDQVCSDNKLLGELIFFAVCRLGPESIHYQSGPMQRDGNMDVISVGVTDREQQRGDSFTRPIPSAISKFDSSQTLHQIQRPICI